MDLMQPEYGPVWLSKIQISCYMWIHDVQVQRDVIKQQNMIRAILS